MATINTPPPIEPPPVILARRRRVYRLCIVAALTSALLSLSSVSAAAQNPVVPDIGDNCRWASVERSDLVDGQVSTAKLTLKSNMAALHLPSTGLSGTMDDNDGWYVSETVPAGGLTLVRDRSLIDRWANPKRRTGYERDEDSDIRAGKYGPFFLIDHAYYVKSFREDRPPTRWTNLLIGNRQFRTPATASALSAAVGPSSVTIKRDSSYNGSGWITVVPIEVPYPYFKPNLRDKDQGTRSSGTGYIPKNHPRQVGQPCRIALFLGTDTSLPPYQSEPKIIAETDKAKQSERQRFERQEAQQEQSEQQSEGQGQSAQQSEQQSEQQAQQEQTQQQPEQQSEQQSEGQGQSEGQEQSEQEQEQSEQQSEQQAQQQADTSALEAKIQGRIDRTAARGDSWSNAIWRRALAAVRGEDPPDGLPELRAAFAQRLADGHGRRGRAELSQLWQNIADALNSS